MLRQIAHKIRHAPFLGQLNPFWDFVRPTYQNLLDPFDKGVRVTVGGAVDVRMPKEYIGGRWESYEPEEVRAIVSWLLKHPGSLFVDVGCAVGIYSLIALTLGAKVIAFDSDINAIKMTERFCRYQGTPQLLWGFVSERHESGRSLDSLLELTSRRVTESHATGKPGTNRYTCIGSDSAIPTHSLDGLLPDRLALIKCDIEGAEMLMLKGAERFIETNRPHIALSVHPPALPEYGHTVTEVSSFLRGHRYEIDLLATDHEEHWWCSPLS